MPPAPDLDKREPPLETPTQCPTGVNSCLEEEQRFTEEKEQPDTSLTSFEEHRKRPRRDIKLPKRYLISDNNFKKKTCQTVSEQLPSPQLCSNEEHTELVPNTTVGKPNPQPRRSCQEQIKLYKNTVDKLSHKRRSNEEHTELAPDATKPYRISSKLPSTKVLPLQSDEMDFLVPHKVKRGSSQLLRTGEDYHSQIKMNTGRSDTICPQINHRDLNGLRATTSSSLDNQNDITFQPLRHISHTIWCADNRCGTVRSKVVQCDQNCATGLASTPSLRSEVKEATSKYDITYQLQRSANDIENMVTTKCRVNEMSLKVARTRQELNEMDPDTIPANFIENVNPTFLRS